MNLFVTFLHLQNLLISLNFGIERERENGGRLLVGPFRKFENLKGGNGRGWRDKPRTIADIALGKAILLCVLF